MDRRARKYKIAVIVLSVLVVSEALFLFILRRQPGPRPPVSRAEKGRIAIVLDDWGYNSHNLYLLGQLKQPLTLSVLPNLPYSVATAKEARLKGLEVILHLPMEPREKDKLEKDTIMVNMPQEQIKDIINRDLAGIPYAKGVSNHMGSRATEDARTVAIVFKELKRRKLYFLDSLVSPESACQDLAHKMHIGFARRDIFLDNREDPDSIKGQLQKLKARARVYGQAIGIGHARKATLEALRQAMPELDQEGYKFIFVSEMVK